MIKESGFLHTEEIDSGFYFTIGNTRSIKCDTPFVRQPGFYKDIWKSLQKRQEHVSPDFKVDSNKVFNGISYDILFYNKTIENPPIYAFEAFTSYKNRHILIQMQNNVSPKDSFYNTAMKILSSVKIK